MDLAEMAVSNRQDRLMNLSEAAEYTGLPEEHLIDLINQGKLPSYVYGQPGDLVVVVIEKDLLRATLSIERYREKYGDQTISMREAARMLEVSVSSVFRWVKKGFIRRIEKPAELPKVETPRNSKRRSAIKPAGQETPPLSLADVLYYQDVLRLAKLQNPGRQGYRLLDDNGNLFEPK